MKYKKSQYFDALKDFEHGDFVLIHNVYIRNGITNAKQSVKENKEIYKIPFTPQIESKFKNG